MRILNPRPIPNQKSEISRPASAPVRSSKKVFDEIPSIAQVTMDQPILESVESDDSGEIEIPAENPSEQTKLLKSKNPSPMIELGLVVGQTSSVALISANEICFGAGTVLVRLDLTTLTQKCLTGSDSTIFSVAVYDGILISGSADGTIRFWRDNRPFLLIKTSVQARFMKLINSSLIICGRSTKLGSSFTSVSIWNISKVAKSEIATEICRGSTDQVVHSLDTPGNSNQIRFCTGGLNGVRIWRTRKLNHLTPFFSRVHTSL